MTGKSSRWIICLSSAPVWLVSPSSPARATGDEPVPSCPDWTTRDLIQHLGTIHRWAGAIVLSGQRQNLPKPIFGEDLVEWYAGTAAALLAALQAVDVDEPTPNFSLIDETAGFFHRRQMHEVDRPHRRCRPGAGRAGG